MESGSSPPGQHRCREVFHVGKIRIRWSLGSLASLKPSLFFLLSFPVLGIGPACQECEANTPPLNSTPDLSRQSISASLHLFTSLSVPVTQPSCQLCPPPSLELCLSNIFLLCLHASLTVSHQCRQLPAGKPCTPGFSSAPQCRPPHSPAASPCSAACRCENRGPAQTLRPIQGTPQQGALPRSTFSLLRC